MSFYNTYDFEISQVASLLMYQKIDKTNGGCDSMSRIIKRGMFTITNEKEAVKIMDNLTDLLNIVPRLDRLTNSVFISACVDYYNTTKDYNHSKFCDKIERYKDDLKFVITEKSAVINFFKKMK